MKNQGIKKELKKKIKENEECSVNTPSFYAKHIGLPIQDIINEYEHISQSSLSNARKRTPKKYEALMIGIVALKKGVTLDDIKYLSIIKQRVS